MEKNTKKKQSNFKKLNEYMINNKYWLSVHTLLLLILVNISSAYAASLINGGFISGAISTPTDKHSYTFSAQAGESVLISIADTSGKPFVPQINLYGPSGAYITYSLNRIEYKITGSGTFTVDVFDQAAIGEKTGTYNLYFAHMPGANENEGGNLINGGHISDSIDLGDLDSYTFTAQAGESVLISLADTSDIGFAPRMYLYNNDGVFLEWDHNRIESTITENGTYTIVVLDSVSVGEKFGTYNLYFALIPGANENEGGELINGKVISDSIDLGDLDSYTFSAQAGENIEFTINDTSAKGFVPRLYLYNPDGSFISWNKNSSKLFHTAAKSGTYTVVVLDDVVIGERTGTYDLILYQGLGLSNVQITQAVFDDDGVNDIVLNRTTVILATVNTSIDSGTTTIRACMMNAEGLCDEDRSLGAVQVDLSKISGSEEFKLSFTLESDHFKFATGVDQIIVEIDPNNLITEENDDKKDELIVRRVETKKLKIAYTLLTPPTIECKFGFCIPDKNEDIFIEEATSILLDIFPLADKENKGLLFRRVSKLTGSDNEKSDKWPSPCDGSEIEVSIGVYKDLMHIQALSKSIGNRSLGLVTKEYFDYHLPEPAFSSIEGLTMQKYVPDTSIVLIRHPATVAHELGHTLGFHKDDYSATTDENGNCNVGSEADKGKKVQEGFRLSTGKRINSDTFYNFMGSVQTKDDTFISLSNWKSLMKTLSESLPDPELIVISSLISKDGSSELGPWSTFDGIPDLIPEGDYHILMKNQNREIISDISFPLSFQIHVDPIGLFETNTSYIANTVPYPLSTAFVSVVAPDGSVMFEIDPVIKILNDSVSNISDTCFIENAPNNRQEIEQLSQDLETLLIDKNYYDAIFLLETNFKNHVESTIVSNCYDSLTLKTSKEDLLNLISKTIPHIEARIINTDSDGDGIWDDKDTCPDTNINDTVIIQECDSDVTNTVMENGCSINDEVLNCDGNGNSMEQFVSCIDQLANRLIIDEIISIQDKELIQSCITKPVLGDLDDDGDVDRADYSLFRSTLGKCEGDDKFISTADYDDDECITYGDYRTWMGYYRNQ